MTNAVTALSEARPAARLFRAWWLVAAALGLLPIVRVWQLTEDTDTAVTTLAVFAGAAWQIGSLLEVAPQRPSRGARAFGWTLLVGTFWQLGWIGLNDFWFFRLALGLIAAAWLLLAWGWTGWIWGWRILAAFAAWGYFSGSLWQWSRDASQWGDGIGHWLSGITAHLAASVLAAGGAPVAAAGNAITWGAYTVSVGVPCTALALAKLLLLLLLLATLLLRIDLLRALWLAAVAIIVSFAISLGRVMLLAYVVRRPASFHYWHDPDGGGGGWFTAIGMVILAVLVARQLARKEAESFQPATGHDLPTPPSAGRIGALGLSAWALGCLGSTSTIDPLVAPAAAPPYRVFRDETTVGAATAGMAPNAPAWVRRIVYRSDAGAQDFQVMVSAIPLTLAGDPHDNAGLTELFGSGGPRWLVTVAPGDTTIQNAGEWRTHLAEERTRPRRWLAWFSHRRGLRDKHTFWLAAASLAPQAATDQAPPQLFTDWIAVLLRSR